MWGGVGVCVCVCVTSLFGVHTPDRHTSVAICRNDLVCVICSYTYSYIIHEWIQSVSEHMFMGVYMLQLQTYVYRHSTAMILSA